jgi:hypothetical protein
MNQAELDRQYHDMAATIAAQAQAIADGTITGPRFAAASRLLGNAKTLMAWTPDDRSGVSPMTNAEWFSPCPACGSNRRHPALAYILHEKGCTPAARKAARETGTP